ncbi:hypothetical protein BaRGS_00040250 [Batillaria attramentaria]|uniref:Uncharacterized protein n=1 Tax=Batillaria attramentaria TaxID=370345 RepID=A0ABD0J1H9_9CAEN
MSAKQTTRHASQTNYMRCQSNKLHDMPVSLMKAPMSERPFLKPSSPQRLDPTASQAKPTPTKHAKLSTPRAFVKLGKSDWTAMLASEAPTEWAAALEGDRSLLTEYHSGQSLRQSGRSPSWENCASPEYVNNRATMSALRLGINVFNHHERKLQHGRAGDRSVLIAGHLGILGSLGLFFCVSPSLLLESDAYVLL